MRKVGQIKISLNLRLIFLTKIEYELIFQQASIVKIDKNNEIRYNKILKETILTLKQIAQTSNLKALLD